MISPLQRASLAKINSPGGGEFSTNFTVPNNTSRSETSVSQSRETTEDGAHRAATQQRNRYSGGFQNKESSWFSSQDDDGTYAEYNKFRNTHRTMDSTREPFL